MFLKSFFDIYLKYLVYIIIMYKSSYKYGPPPFINSIQTRSLRTEDVIVTSIPTNLITEVLNESIQTGDVNFDTVEVNLDNITGGSTTIQNIVVNTLTTTNTYMRILSDLRLEGRALFGSTTNVDENYKVDIQGSLNVAGDITNIDTEQLIIRDNCVAIGVNSSSLDNFMNGIFFPRRDQYLGAGNSIDKVGALSLPYGTFQSNRFIVQQSELKRFEDNKSSLRFVYILSDYDLNSTKTDENPISASEQEFINSLNNVNNQSSTFYLNIESHNITLHGGNLIAGVNKDLNFYLTGSSGNEDSYMKFNSTDQTIEINKKIKLVGTDFNIQNSGKIHYQTSDSTPKEFFQIGTTGNFSFRDLNLYNNGTNNANIIFGATSGNTQDTLSIAYDKNGTKVINLLIDSGNTATNRIELKSRLEVLGPNTTQYPSLVIKNENSDDIIANNTPPQSRTYYQNKLLGTSTNVNFLLSEVHDATASDVLITGFIIVSSINTNSSNNKHLHLKLEGTYNSSNNNPVTNMIFISKKDINFTNSSSTSDIFVTLTPNMSSRTIGINIINNLSNTSFKVMIKLELIST